jgi:hypothetical protein
VALKPEFAALLNSRPIIWRIESDAPQFSAFVASILSAVTGVAPTTGGREADTEELANAVRRLLLNLLDVRYGDPSRFLSVAMSAGAYRKGFGYWALRSAVRACVDRGFIEYHRGFWSKEARKGFVTRIRATDALMAIASQHGVRPGHLQRSERDPLVELRATDGTAVDWPADEKSQFELKRMEDNLRTINRCLGECFIGLHVPDPTITDISKALLRERPESSWVDFRDRELYRVFNHGSTKLGGRFYGGWWQLIPKEYRKYIHLAVRGQQPKWTVELDFKSMHPVMLYARMEIKAPWDCYDLGPGAYLRGGALRDYAKQGLLTLLNASSRDAAEASLRQYVADGYFRQWRRDNPDIEPPKGLKIADMVPQGWPSVPDLLNQLSKFHAPIREFFCTGIALELMCTESDIVEQVMLTMLTKKIVVLPIHDSFLVPAGAQETLKYVMEYAFRHANKGRPCEISQDRTEFDLFVRERHDERVEESELVARINAEDRKSSSVYWTLREDWEAGAGRGGLDKWPKLESRDDDEWNTWEPRVAGAHPVGVAMAEEAK